MPTTVAYSPIPLEIESTSPGDAVSSAYIFKWNGRECRGNHFHEAIFNDDIESVARILDTEPALLSSRFHYETKTPTGQTQEGSGEPIHLSVSHGLVQISELLVKRKADLYAMVTRGGQGHYDVLHAAIFAEGKGGTDEMVRSLLHMRAPLQKNLSDEYPLHKAFQTGKTSLIVMLMDEQERRGLPDLEDVPPDHKVPTPIEIGIKLGQMSESELALVAPKTVVALHVFVKHEPRCIPKWLERVSHLHGSALAQQITVRELSSVYRRAPHAGDALLSALISRPQVESVGWHPLPSRVSFAPRTRWEYILSLVNPCRTYMTFYMEDTAWKYDGVSFKAPDWHKPITDREFGRPIYDAEFSICHVPNLACSTFVSSLLSNENSDEIFIFQNPIVSGLITYIWNTAAFKICLLRVALSIWGLSVLIFEQLVDPEDQQLERMLGRASSSGESGSGGVGPGRTCDTPACLPDAIPTFLAVGACPMAIAFIGARGVIELVEEIIITIAYVRMGEWRRGVNFAKLWSVVVNACIPIMILHSSNRYLYIAVVLLYWVSLLKVEYIAENMARAMLPISELATKLGPTLLLTFVGFAAFTHAFFIMHGGAPTAASLLLQSFAILFTGSLPEDSNVGLGELFLTCLAVLVFMLFLLNIFIGVMSEEYSLAKDRVPLRFQQVLAEESLRYLLIASFIPQWRWLNKLAPGVVTLMLFLTLSFQLAVHYQVEFVMKVPAHSFFITTLCISHICLSQDSMLFSKGSNRYLWVLTAKVKEKKDDHMSYVLSQLKAINERLDSASRVGVGKG